MESANKRASHTGANFLYTIIPTVGSCASISATRLFVLDAIKLLEQLNYSIFMLNKMVIYKPRPLEAIVKSLSPECIL
jgi:hypothetical protein